MIEAVWFVLCGLVGALSRVLVQIWRDKKVTQTGPEAVAELGLGLIFGWVAYQMGLSTGAGGYLMAWALGFVAPDVAENFAEHYDPVEGE